MSVLLFLCRTCGWRSPTGMTSDALQRPPKKQPMNLIDWKLHLCWGTVKILPFQSNRNRRMIIHHRPEMQLLILPNHLPNGQMGMDEHHRPGFVVKVLGKWWISTNHVTGRCGYVIIPRASTCIQVLHALYETFFAMCMHGNMMDALWECLMSKMKMSQWAKTTVRVAPTPGRNSGHGSA